jgi:hypothetical protein
MQYVFKHRRQSSTPAVVFMVALSSLNQMLAQEVDGVGPGQFRSLPLPASLVESMRNQVNPFQPRKLQSLLLKPEVQGELQIGRETYGIISSAMRELDKQQLEYSRSRLAYDPNDREAMRENMESQAALRAERDRATEEALTEVFPPEKFVRLKQIALQIQIREAGLGNVLLYGVLRESVKLTDAQREALASKAEQYETEKQAKIRKITEEYDAKLLGHLTRKQRQKFDEQVGEPFPYEPTSSEGRNFQQFRQFNERFAAPEAP